MAKKMYVVRVNAPEGIVRTWDYPTGYFPRKTYYLKDAKEIAQTAIKKGATMARIEYPEGGELDFRPQK